MKKALSLFLALTLALCLLTGCGDTSSSSNPAQNGGSSQSQGEDGSDTQGEDGVAPDTEGGNETPSDALTAQEVGALTGTTLPGSFMLETSGCAVMVGYLYENPDGTQASMDALEAQLTTWAEDNGKVPAAVSDVGESVYYLVPSAEDNGTAPVAVSGVGENIYYLMPSDLERYTVLVLGEEGSLKPGVQSGGARRFARCNRLLPPMNGGTEWHVSAVEEQDYYEEDGVQYPCYFIWLTE